MLSWAVERNYSACAVGDVINYCAVLNSVVVAKGAVMVIGGNNQSVWV